MWEFSGHAPSPPPPCEPMPATFYKSLSPPLPRRPPSPIPCLFICPFHLLASTTSRELEEKADEDDDENWEWEVFTQSDEMGDSEKLLPPSWPTVVILSAPSPAPTDWHHPSAPVQTLDDAQTTQQDLLLVNSNKVQWLKPLRNTFYYLVYTNSSQLQYQLKF